MFAYGLQQKQIVGEAPWVDETADTVNGVLDAEGEPNMKQWQQAMQKLLMTRVGVRAHREKLELSYSALRVNETPKLVKEANPAMPPDQSGDGGTQRPRIKYTSNIMDEFVIGMNYLTDRSVVNETGYRDDGTARYDGQPIRSGQVILPQMRLQDFSQRSKIMGLKLEPVKGPVDVLVLDGVERLSAN